MNAADTSACRGIRIGCVSAPRRDAVRTSSRSWPGTMRRLRTGTNARFWGLARAHARSPAGTRQACAARGLRMRLQIGLGNSLLHTRGPSEQAQTVLTEALESAEALGDLRAQLRILLDLASVIGFRGEYARAAAASERAGAIAQQIGDTT